MSDAYKCDFCKKMYDGQPHRRIHEEYRRGDTNSVKDMCKSCWKDYSKLKE